MSIAFSYSGGADGDWNGDSQLMEYANQAGRQGMSWPDFQAYATSHGTTPYKVADGSAFNTYFARGQQGLDANGNPAPQPGTSMSLYSAPQANMSWLSAGISALMGPRQAPPSAPMPTMPATGPAQMGGMNLPFNIPVNLPGIIGGLGTAGGVISALGGIFGKPTKPTQGGVGGYDVPANIWHPSTWLDSGKPWPRKKNGQPRRQKKNGQPYKAPHMNPLNPRALRRADKRVQTFAHIAKHVMRDLGYHYAPTRKAHGKKTKRR